MSETRTGISRLSQSIGRWPASASEPALITSISQALATSSPPPSRWFNRALRAAAWASPFPLTPANSGSSAGRVRSPLKMPCSGQRSASGQCLGERHFVGVLEVGAHRKPARETGHTGLSAQLLGDVKSGCLARRRRIRGEQDLSDIPLIDAPQELGDSQVL